MAVTEQRLVQVGAALTGLTFAASASLAAELAREHAGLARICGDATPHCGWCYLAAGLAASALAAFAYALGPRRNRRR